MMKKWGKTWLSMGMAGLMAVSALMTGCGGGGGNKTDAVTLNVAMALSEEEWAAMKDKVFKGFEEKTGIRVNGIQVEHADMEGKMEALAQANKADIDIIAPDNMLLPGLVTKGLIKDLSRYEDKIPSEILKNLYEDFKFDGKLYFMPYRPNVKVEFYDEARFRQYGLKAPETWDELLEVAKTFKEKEGIARYGYMGKQGGARTVTLFEFIRSAGGDPVVLNDEGSVKAFRFLQELYQYTSSEVIKSSFAEVNSMLATGTVYLAGNWPFCANVVVKEGGKTDIKAYVGVKGPEGYNKVLGGNVLAIAENTAHMEEAMQFIEYIMSKEAQEAFITDMGWMPAREDALGAVEEWQKPYMEAVLEAAKYAEPRPVLAYFSEVDKAINDAYQEIVVDGATDIQGILDRYHTEIEKAKAAQ